ncbi:MAG TPA: GAF domain-containing protein [Herpetosiphonaceae bacterium]
MAKRKLPAEPLLERELLADRARELMVLNAIAAAVAASLEPQPLLASALDHVLDLLDFDAGAIYTREDGKLELIVHRGIDAALIDERGVLRMEQPQIATLVAEHKPLALVDLRATPGLEPLATDAGFHSLLALPLFARGDVAGILVVLRAAAHALSAREITLLEAIADHIALALDNARLFAAEQQRRRQAETLRVAATAVGSTLDLSAVLETILAQLQEVVSYYSATVQLREGHEVRVIAVRGFVTDQDLRGIRFPLTDDYPNRRVIEEARTVLLPDAPAAYPNFDADHMLHIRSWMGVPLCYAGQAVGMITLDRTEPNAFTAAEAQLAESFAQQAALAIENARLFAAEQQRRRQSEALRKGALALTEALGLDAVLRRIVQQATELMETPMCALYELDPGSGQLTLRNTWDIPGASGASGAQIGEQIVSIAIKANRTVTVPDIGDADWRQKHDLAVPERTRLSFQSMLAAPLLVKGRIYGGIVVFYEHARNFSADEVQLLDIFADQAALALEHARLVDQSRQLAALEERQRIARDLHDSVTQTLFSLTLAAQAARTTATNDLAAADAMLQTVQDLASGALAEMRALIFELRPGALREAGLAAAIERFVGAFRSRTGIKVELELDSQRLPDAVEEALYRITSEALANVGKHACASQVKITLCHATTHVELHVRDNGVGFDPCQPAAGDHMGQRTMQERAAALGGSCVVQSAPGQGTDVVVKVPLVQSE